MKVEKTSFDGSLLVKLLLWLLFFLTPLIFYAWATTFNITKETFAELIILVIFTLWFFRLTELGLHLMVFQADRAWKLPSSQILPHISHPRIFDHLNFFPFSNHRLLYLHLRPCPLARIYSDLLYHHLLH